MKNKSQKGRVRRFGMDSKLNFGQYQGLTPRDILTFTDIGVKSRRIDGHNYLRWCRKHFKWVDFSKEVIEEMTKQHQKPLKRNNKSEKLECEEVLEREENEEDGFCITQDDLMDDLECIGDHDEHCTH